MKINEFFIKLSESELANLSLGESGAGCIQDSNLNKLIHATNSGLTFLHKRFILKVGTHTLETVSNVLEYHPTLTNFIKYLSVFSETENMPVPLNDNTRQYSVTSYPNGKIVLPSEGIYVLSYQANHPLINKAGLNNELDIPQVLVQPLSDYVAHSIYGSMNSAENTSIAIRYLTSFNQALLEIEKSDSLGNSKLGVNDKFSCNGWI